MVEQLLQEGEADRHFAEVVEVVAQCRAAVEVGVRLLRWEEVAVEGIRLAAMEEAREPLEVVEVREVAVLEAVEV